VAGCGDTDYGDWTRYGEGFNWMKLTWLQDIVLHLSCG